MPVDSLLDTVNFARVYDAYTISGLVDSKRVRELPTARYRLSDDGEFCRIRAIYRNDGHGVGTRLSWYV
jgi:hypothetical protein